MSLKTNDFIVSGFVTQPDGITPVPGDLKVLITNDGAFSNGGVPSTITTPVVNGEFSVNLSGFFPAPLFRAAGGDTLTFNFQKTITNLPLSVNVNGFIQASFSVKLTDDDIIARNNNPLEPLGKLETIVVMKDVVTLNTTDLLFRGDVFQPDGSTHVPFGLEVLVENLTKNTLYAITVGTTGKFSQHIAGSPGFDSQDQIRMTIRNSLTGTPLAIRNLGIARPYLSRALKDQDIIALGTIPNNKGQLVESFRLDQPFSGLLLPPHLVTTEGLDESVIVTWSQVFNPDLIGYRIRRSITLTGPFIDISPPTLTTDTQFTDTNLINEIPYYYTISTVTTSGESLPSGAQQGTPHVSDSDYSVRQILSNRFVAGRTATIHFSALRSSGPTNGLSVVIKYRDFSGAIREFIVYRPIITPAGIYLDESNSVIVPGDAERFLDVRFRQPVGSSFLVDNISLTLSGSTTDPTARTLVAPSYNFSNSKIIVKNLLPGDLILVDVETGVPTRIQSAGNSSSPNINATDDPVEWAENDKTLVYSYFTGLDSHQNIQSHLRRVDFNPATCDFFAVPVDIPDTLQGFFPKVNAVPTSCTKESSIVYLYKPTASARAIKTIALRGSVTSTFLPIDATGANSIDVDADGNIVFSTSDAILENTVSGGLNRLIIQQGGEFIQWGHKTFVPGKLIAYIRTGSDVTTSDVYVVTAVQEASTLSANRAEFLLNSLDFPEGLLDIKIRAIDKSTSANQTIVDITAIINNTFNVRPMTATAITDPGVVKDTNTVTSPGAIVGGITNKCTLMSAGTSSANRGRLEFFTRDDNQLLSTLSDIFTDTPELTMSLAGIASALPLKLRFTWLTDLIASEAGGGLHPCILTVDTGGVARNIFIPEIDASTVNPLVLYVAEDGSTYFDPQLRDIARKSSSDPLVTIAPELNPLPRFTNAATVLVKWCTVPGSPRDLVSKYILLRSTEPNGGYLPIFTTLDNLMTRYQDSDLIDGTTYFYKIQAIDILGNVIQGTDTVFTITDRTGALEKLGFIQVDLSTDDVNINEQSRLEPGTGRVFSPRTTFSLSPLRNAKNPAITQQSKLFADFTFQKAKDILLRLQPVLTTDSVAGEISGTFVQDQDFIFLKDKNVQSGSVRAKDKVRFIKQERLIVEEETVRGAGVHGADGLGHLFATAIESVSMPLTVSGEPVTPLAGFLFQLTNTEPGRKIEEHQQIILEVHEVTNTTKGLSYEINDITPFYTTSPAIVQLDIFSNMARFPSPDPTDSIVIRYTYLKVFPSTSYQLDRSQNAIRWLGIDPSQPLEAQRYLVTYRHLAPVPGERITIGYTTNNLIQTLQFGDLNTGVQGLDDKRHICADVLARETTPIPIDIQMLVRLFDTADEGFVSNLISNTVGSLFNGKKLGQGIRISDIACSVQRLTDVESVKLDPFDQLGRTDTPNLLRIFAEDTANFSVKPGRIEGEVTFFTQIKPTANVVIPSGTIVSNDLKSSKEVLLFQTANTFTAPLNVIDTFYNPLKDRFEFKVNIISLFVGAATLNRREINTIGGELRNSLSIENEKIVEGAAARQEVVPGNGSFTLQPLNGQLIEIQKVQNFSARNIEAIPANANFIKLKKQPITNARGDAIGLFGDSSLVIDDRIIFKTEVATPPSNPGEYFVNYAQGYIQTFTKTPFFEMNQQIRYTYLEDYNLNFVQISPDQTTFTMNGPSNAGKPVPQPGDYILVDYRWTGNGVPLKYRLETFSTPNGLIDLSFIKSAHFTGPIFINNRTEKIENITQHPLPPFYAIDPTNNQLSTVGRQLATNEEVIFRFSTPFEDIDVSVTTFDLQNRQDISRFTFNLDFQKFNVTSIEFLEMGGDSVQIAPGMIINAGLTVTKENQVVVQLAALNAKDMVLSTDSLFRDKTELDFVPFTTTTVFLLDGADGFKTIYAKIRFDNPGIQDVVLNSTIELNSESNTGLFIPIATNQFQYAQGTGLLKIPTSFGQSDMNINDMESIRLNSLGVSIDPLRVRRTF